MLQRLYTLRSGALEASVRLDHQFGRAMTTAERAFRNIFRWITMKWMGSKRVVTLKTGTPPLHCTGLHDGQKADPSWVLISADRVVVLSSRKMTCLGIR